MRIVEDRERPPNHFHLFSNPRKLAGQRATDRVHDDRGRERRLRRGYSETESTRRLRVEAEQTRAFVSTGVITLDQLQAIGIPVAMATLAIEGSPLILAAISLPAVIAVGRALRGCEAMTHEASHQNVCRKHRWVNDTIVNIGASISVFSTVARFRAGHLKEHHGGYGSIADPCRDRYMVADFDGIRRTCGVLTFGLDVARRLPSYYVRWWRAIGSDLETGILAASWHCIIWAGITTAIGWDLARVALLYWIASFAIGLPIIRMIGEADEHDYGGSTEFEGTYSSLGRTQRFIFHPHGDGYHAEHHRYARVPHHRLRRLRKDLLSLDPAWIHAPFRSRVMESRNYKSKGARQ